MKDDNNRNQVNSIASVAKSTNSIKGVEINKNLNILNKFNISRYVIH